jgi:hypothetical protein
MSRCVMKGGVGDPYGYIRTPSRERTIATVAGVEDVKKYTASIYCTVLTAYIKAQEEVSSHVRTL